MPDLAKRGQAAVAKRADGDKDEERAGGILPTFRLLFDEVRGMFDVISFAHVRDVLDIGKKWNLTQWVWRRLQPAGREI